jgi:hypothetical protein
MIIPHAGCALYSGLLWPCTLFCSVNLQHYTLRCLTTIFTNLNEFFKILQLTQTSFVSISVAASTNESWLVQQSVDLSMR